MTIPGADSEFLFAGRKMKIMNWHAMGVEETLRAVDTDPKSGLTPEEAAKRFERHGPNELRETGGKSAWQILWEQLTAAMVLILIVAAAISALLGDFKDATAIMAIVVLNAALGLSQELRAERALAALKKLAAPVVKVMRGGRVREIPSREVVPGDMVLLETGNLVPADCRLGRLREGRLVRGPGFPKTAVRSPCPAALLS